MKKLKNDEIENDFQIEIMFSNLKITIKRKGITSKGKINWRANVIFSRGNK